MTTRIATRREHTGDRQLDVMQRETQRLAQGQNACPFLAGNLVTGVILVAGTPLTVNHGLGRAPRGCIVVRSYGANAAPPPVESAAQPPDLTRQIALQTIANATFDLWFW